MVRRCERFGAARSDTAFREAEQGRVRLHGTVQLELAVPTDVVGVASQPAGTATIPAAATTAVTVQFVRCQQHVTLATNVY